jgi:hypothetical protein
MEALQVVLGCPTDRDGRPSRPPGMSQAEAEAFAARWHAGRARLVESYPDSADLWTTLDEVFR